MSETFQNYSFEVDDTSTRKYQLDVSELYEYPAATAVQPLKTCPLTSEIKQVEAPWSSGNQFVFDTLVLNSSLVTVLNFTLLSH
jgi:hypothetical protein